jgi:hypothetical protein
MLHRRTAGRNHRRFTNLKRAQWYLDEERRFPAISAQRQKSPSDPNRETIYSFFTHGIAATGNMILPDGGDGSPCSVTSGELAMIASPPRCNRRELAEMLKPGECP